MFRALGIYVGFGTWGIMHLKVFFVGGWGVPEDEKRDPLLESSETLNYKVHPT